jgi:hypothetical protein
VVSIDSFVYYGTDDLYLGYLARFLAPGAPIGIAGAGLTADFDEVPEHLRAWWEPALACLHTPRWWRRHWSRSGLVEVRTADAMPDGWRRWLAWQHEVSPDNAVEIDAVTADAGRHLGYVRVVGSRTDTPAEEPITTIPVEYEPHPLLRP